MNYHWVKLFLFLLSGSLWSTPAGNWPAWRGPHGDGVCDETGLPTVWNTTNHVRWKTALPEPGNATPITWGNKVFVTQAIGSERMLLCFDRATGRELWRAGAKSETKELTHATNPQCAASPVTDGERVVVYFGSVGVLAYDLNGKLLWQRDLGPQRHIWGYGSSPVLLGDRCFLNFGPGAPSFLIALDKRTGKTLWQIDDPNGDVGEKKGDEKPKWTGSWSTPLPIRERDQDTLIVALPKRLVSLDPATGRETWVCRGLNDLVYTSPLLANGVLVAMGGFGGMSLSVRTGGSGEVTDSHRLWYQPKTRQRIGSGVISDGHVFILNDPGVAECFELKTGRLVWEQTLQGSGPTKQNWSSLMLAERRLYAINQAGDCLVFRAEPRFEMISVNPLGERSNSSMIASDGELFIRTHKHLWCIRDRP